MPTLTRIRASDVTGQRCVDVMDIPREHTMGELIRDLTSEMRLPISDVEGRPLAYHALHLREGRHVHASEVVGDTLQEDDEISLQPNIDAG